MEWLKMLLEEVSGAEGKLDVDAVMKAAAKEFPKHAVPKKVFNSKIAALKEANSTIEKLKKASKDLVKIYSLKEQLTKAGVQDPDYLIYKLGGIENFDIEEKAIEFSDLQKEAADERIRRQ